VDANVWRKLPYVLLIAGLLAIGTWPMLLTGKMKEAVSQTLEPVNSLTAQDQINTPSE
jgi:hypothetical protein